MSDDQRMHEAFTPSETMVPLLDGRKTCVTLPLHIAETMRVGDALKIVEVKPSTANSRGFELTGYEYTGLITWIDRNSLQATLSLKNVGYVVPAELMGYSPTREGAN